MARKKVPSFTEAEVRYVAASLMASCLRNNVLLLVDSGAEASGEIGKIIMHLAKGSNIYHKEATTVSESLYLAAVTDPAAEERLQMLEDIISGESK